MLNEAKSAFGGKRIILGLMTAFILFIFSSGPARALTTKPSPAPTLVATPAAQKSNYILPYPGILPDHPLYFLKMLRDRILDLFTQAPLKKTEFLILMADKRLGAGKTLIDYGKINLGETTISKGENYLERAVSSISQIGSKGEKGNEVLDKLKESLAKHIEVLQEVQQKVPEEAKSGITNALERAQKGYQKVLEIKGQK